MFSVHKTVKEMLVHVAQLEEGRRRAELIELVAGLDDESLREAIGELAVAAHDEDSPLLDLYTFQRLVQERHAERRRLAVRRMSNYEFMSLFGNIRGNRQYYGVDSDSLEPSKRAGYVCACIEVDVVEDELNRRLGKWLHHSTPCKAIPEPPPTPKEEEADEILQEPV